MQVVRKALEALHSNQAAEEVYYEALLGNMVNGLGLATLLYVLAFNRRRPARSATLVGHEASNSSFVTHVVCDNPDCGNVRHVAWGGACTNKLEALVHRWGTGRNFFWRLLRKDGFQKRFTRPSQVFSLRP